MKTQLPVISNCDDCGACCTGQSALPIHLLGGGVFTMPGCSPLTDELRLELQQTIERFEAEGWLADDSPCIWYDAEAKRCKHYEHRPTICRDEVKPGDEACRRWRRSLKIDSTLKFRVVGGKLRRVKE